MTTRRAIRIGAAILVTAAFATLAAACAPAAPVPEAIPGTITLHEEGSPFVAFNIWVKVGSQNDPAGKEGLASLAANLLSDGGTEQNTYQEIVSRLYPMATGYGVSVDKEMTNFSGTVHIDNLDGFYELLRNALLSPAFDESDFERVKAQTMNYLERGRRYNRDEELSKELLYWMAYQGTPFAHPEEGYVQSVTSITLDDVRAFYEQYYVRNNIVVGVAGGYPDGLVERVRADFDTRPEGEVPMVPAPQPAMPASNQVLIVEKDTDATAISFGFPTTLQRGGEDFYAMKLVNAWMGDHRNSFSNLYQVIREKRGMNYGDYTYIEPFPMGYTTQSRPVNAVRRSNLFEVWIRPISLTEPGNLHSRTLFATRAGLREVANLVAHGLPEDQIARTQKYLYDFSLNYGDTTSRRLAFAIDDAFYGLEGDAGYLAAIRPELAKLDKARVDAAIREHLAAPGYYMVFITADAEAFKALLLSGDATGITYNGEQPPEILSEDEEIANFPIPVTEDAITIMSISEVFESGS
jgi:zinc protease